MARPPSYPRRYRDDHAAPHGTRRVVRHVRDDAQPPAHGAARWWPHRLCRHDPVASADLARAVGRGEAAGVVLGGVAAVGLHRARGLARPAAPSARARCLSPAAAIEAVAVAGEFAAVPADVCASAVSKLKRFSVLGTREYRAPSTENRVPKTEYREPTIA